VSRSDEYKWKAQEPELRWLSAVRLTRPAARTHAARAPGTNSLAAARNARQWTDQVRGSTPSETRWLRNSDRGWRRREVLSQEFPFRLTQRMAGTRVSLTEEGATCPHAQDVDRR
jgi:hypothetical protein